MSALLLDWLLTGLVFCASLGLAAYGNWKAQQPRKLLQVWSINWHFVIIVCGLICVLAVVHAVNLLGVETGTSGPLAPPRFQP
jgi:hypothetical protein